MVLSGGEKCIGDAIGISGILEAGGKGVVKVGILRGEEVRWSFGLLTVRV